MTYRIVGGPNDGRVLSDDGYTVGSVIVFDGSCYVVGSGTELWYVDAAPTSALEIESNYDGC